MFHFSAPSRRITTGNHAEPWRSPVYKEPHIPIPKHYMTKLAENAAPNAPYAGLYLACTKKNS